VRIAQVSPLYESVPPQGYGGTERVVSYLTEALVAAGHEVTLFASGDSRTTAKLVPCCAKSLRLDSDCQDQLAPHLLMMEQVFDRLDEFDAVHWHIDYLHFPLSAEREYAHLTTLHGRLDLPELQEVYTRHPDMPVVSISDNQRLPLPQAAWAGTVYHGMPLDTQQPNYEPEDYLVTVGRMSPEKRIDRAIEIALKCGLRLVIAAKVDKHDQEYFDSELKPLLAKYKPQVEFIGEVGEQERGELVGKARAFVFPIDWPEPFGMVMIEAMSVATPVIAWRHGSVPEVIDEGQTGYIVESIDEAVAAVQSVETLDRYAVHRVFERRFSAERMAADYVKLYERLANAHGPLKHYAAGAGDHSAWPGLLRPGRLRAGR
jgi:glycosyltransferase involved in cell wall biosynthesis